MPRQHAHEHHRRKRAHEHGIIHRNLKPANIKVRADGTVKVLDFGLAKAFDPTASSGAGATMSPTLSIHATQAGLILGTAAYMAPEQARGKPADRRADVWAFGCVLYEMLTGARAVVGKDTTETIAAVMRGEPDWNALPRGTPAPIRRYCIGRSKMTACADWRTLPTPGSRSTMRSRPPASIDHRSTPPSSSRPQFAIGLSLGLIIGAIVASIVVWLTRRPPPVEVARLMIPAPWESFTFFPA